MVTVKFNDVAEFLDELKRDAAEVQRKILRCTFSFRRGNSMPIEVMYVMVTYMVFDQLVMLEHRCGEWMTGTSDQETVRGTAIAIKDKIDAAANELGLELRAGLLS